MLVRVAVAVTTDPTCTMAQSKQACVISQALVGGAWASSTVIQRALAPGCYPLDIIPEERVQGGGMLAS